MRYAVLTHFEKHGSLGNKARHQWDADNLLESYSYKLIKDVIDYYFSVTNDGSWQTLLYKFDEYKAAMERAAEDAENRRLNRQRLKEWASE